MFLILIVIMGMCQSALAQERLKERHVATDRNLEVYPLRQYPGEDRIITERLFPKVVTQNAKGEWICRLCRKIPDQASIKYYGKNSKRRFKFVTYWRLKDNIYWTDRIALTAKDVKFTLARMFYQDLEKQQPLLAPFKIDIDPDDPLKFSIAFERPRFDYYQILSVHLLPAHKSRDIEEKKPSELQLPNYSEYELIFWDDKQVKLRNKTTQSFLYYHSFKSSKNISKLQDYDEIQVSKFSDFKRIKKNIAEQKLNYHISFEITDILTQLLVNTRNPNLSDTSMRQALLSSIDKRRIEKNFQDFASPAYSLEPTKQLISPGYYPYNQKRASQSLDKLGWKFDGESKYRMRYSETLELELAIEDNSYSRELANIVKKSWGKLGISVQIHAYSKSYFIDKILKERRFKDFALIDFKHSNYLAWFQRFHSELIPNSYNFNFQTNYGSYRNKLLDRLISKYLSARNPELNAQLKHDMLTILNKELPTLALSYRNKLAFIKVEDLATSSEMETEL